MSWGFSDIQVTVKEVSPSPTIITNSPTDYPSSNTKSFKFLYNYFKNDTNDTNDL